MVHVIAVEAEGHHEQQPPWVLLPGAQTGVQLGVHGGAELFIQEAPDPGGLAPDGTSVQAPDGLEPIVQDQVHLILQGRQTRGGCGGRQRLGDGSQEGREAEKGAEEHAEMEVGEAPCRKTGRPGAALSSVSSVGICQRER